MERGYQPQTEGERHRHLFSDAVSQLERDQAFLMPESANKIGMDVWWDFFPDAVATHYPFPLDSRRRSELVGLYDEVEEQLQQVDSQHLRPSDQHLRRVIDYMTASLLQLSETRSYLRPFDHTIYSRPWSFMQDAQMTGTIDFATENDYELFARHMSQWPQWVDIAIEAMREGAALGYTQPKCVIDQSLGRLELLLKADGQNPFMTPAHHLPEHFSRTERHRFEKLYGKLACSVVMPAYARLYEFSKDYREAGMDDDRLGMCHLPGGQEEYQTIVDYYTEPHLDIEALHQEARERVDELLSELAPWAGSFQETNRFIAAFYGHLRKQGFSTADEALGYYQELDEHIQRMLPQHFAEVPDVPLLVSIPQDHTARVSVAHYRVSGVGAERAGRMILPIVNTHRYNRPGLGRVLRHEGWPGHHMMHAMYRSRHLPLALMLFPNTAFDEGWATYAETLDDFGALDYDEQYRIMRLLSQLSIARGVVLETGMHGLGWSLEKATTYRETHGGVEAPEVARDDILRFVAWPGQCLTYYEGQKHFVKARTLAQKVLEDAFDLREFHTFMLSDGSMPLSLSDRRLEQWLIAKVEAGIGGA